MTHAELKNRMSSKEVTEWLAFNQMEPFGEVHTDMRSASIVQAIAAIGHGIGGGKGSPPRVKDFMLTKE